MPLTSRSMSHILRNRKYDQEIPQSQTADKPNPWHREEEPGRQNKQSTQLSLPHQDDYKTRMDIKYRKTKHRTITDSHNGSNNKQQQNHRLRTDSSLSHRGGGGVLNAFYWYQIFALDSSVVKVQDLFSSHGSLLTIAMYHHAETL